MKPMTSAIDASRFGASQGLGLSAKLKVQPTYVRISPLPALPALSSSALFLLV